MCECECSHGLSQERSQQGKRGTAGKEGGECSSSSGDSGLSGGRISGREGCSRSRRQDRDTASEDTTHGAHVFVMHVDRQQLDACGTVAAQRLTDCPTVRYLCPPSVSRALWRRATRSWTTQPPQGRARAAFALLCLAPLLPPCTSLLLRSAPWRRRCPTCGR